MFDLSLLLHGFTARATRPIASGEADPQRDERSAHRSERPARVGERVFTEALAGLGHPLNAG